MYIARIFLAQYKLNYSEMQTATEREEYQKGIANDMYAAHLKKIREYCIEPKFYIDNVQSKMNDEDFYVEEDVMEVD